MSNVRGAAAAALSLLALGVTACGGGGLKVTGIRSTHTRPSNVAAYFKVQTSSGDPVGGIKAEEFKINLDSKDPVTLDILDNIKEMENRGYQFEGAEASFELLMKRALGTHRKFFTGLPRTRPQRSGHLEKKDAAATPVSKRILALDPQDIATALGAPLGGLIVSHAVWDVFTFLIAPTTGKEEIGD